MVPITYKSALRFARAFIAFGAAPIFLFIGMLYCTTTSWSSQPKQIINILLVLISAVLLGVSGLMQFALYVRGEVIDLGDAIVLHRTFGPSIEIPAEDLASLTMKGDKLILTDRKGRNYRFSSKLENARSLVKRLDDQISRNSGGVNENSCAPGRAMSVVGISDPG
jgi:hypothetical protein